MIVALNNRQRAILAECEGVIERGRDTFIEVGNALLRIREEGLYRDEFKTFAEYCAAKWEISDRHARRLIEAAEVAGNLESGPTGPVLTESQLRPLARLTPSRQREAFQSAVNGSATGTPTAKEVAAAVEKIEPSATAIEEEKRKTDAAFVSSLNAKTKRVKQLKFIWEQCTKKEKEEFLSWAK